MPPAGERILASGSVQLPRFTLLESGSLLVSPARISDAGTYTCLATNSRGVDEASADLVVWGECAGREHDAGLCVSARPAPPAPAAHRLTRPHLRLPLPVRPAGALLTRGTRTHSFGGEGPGSQAPRMMPRVRGLHRAWPSSESVAVTGSCLGALEAETSQRFL